MIDKNKNTKDDKKPAGGPEFYNDQLGENAGEAREIRDAGNKKRNTKNDSGVIQP